VAPSVSCCIPPPVAEIEYTFGNPLRLLEKASIAPSCDHAGAVSAASDDEASAPPPCRNRVDVEVAIAVRREGHGPAVG
jgi:hypothetical protein